MLTDHLLDRIQQLGGFVSVNTSEILRRKRFTNSYHCDKLYLMLRIGCGSQVLLRKNSSAMLFVEASKLSVLLLSSQGQVERKERVLNMVEQMDKEGFGNCTNTGACEIECPKGISIEYIARMNKEYARFLYF